MCQRHGKGFHKLIRAETGFQLWRKTKHFALTHTHTLARDMCAFGRGVGAETFRGMLCNASNRRGRCLHTRIREHRNTILAQHDFRQNTHQRRVATSNKIYNIIRVITDTLSAAAMPRRHWH